ncbi:amidase [Oceanicola sp. 22II-s10i]|uniref:amidase family protein n=1 Tax=Oceanicola sp. 22II-s10i TaxID=1317116 RepID=UPI000B5257CF|nr:amidase [Oceanicola sp. 22II-s10i]
MTGQPVRHTDDTNGQRVRAALAVWERHIHAFVALADDEPAPATGPLAGVSVGVKDNIDVIGLPTRNGSAACADAVPAAQDAPVVAALRNAGAWIAGKTTTTEFAFTDPTDCRNPYDTARSPGGSSSGSGAAVGAGIVDVALGTQTAGSLCRPAAYCGAVGLKPSFGLVSTQGVTPLAPSFDTVGIIARSVALAGACLAAATGQPHDQPRLPALRVRRILPLGAAPSDGALAALEDAELTLGGLTGMLSPADAMPVDDIVAHHRRVMNHEAHAAHPHLTEPDRLPMLKPRFREALLDGRRITPAEAAESRRALDRARSAFWDRHADTDVLLSLPVPDGAPLIDGTTGFQNWLTPWTVFGGPLLCLPWGADDLGRPRSVMLAARPGGDRMLLALGAALEALAPDLPRPRPRG